MLNFLSKWKGYLAIAVILILAIFIGVREYQHNQQINSLQKQLTAAQGTPATQPTVTKLPDGTTKTTAADISGAGNISANQSNEFAKEVASNEAKLSSGKADNLYTYTVDGTADQAITQLSSQITNGTAPKEVQKADFVTVAKVTDTGGGTTNTGTSNTSTSTGDSQAVIQQTTVKVNSYYNYQPSVYYMPQAYPDTLKRNDIIYTNRDFMLDVNYDADRHGNKVGASIGYRIAKW